MDSNAIENLKHGTETAFLDSTVFSDLENRPQFLFNNYKEGRKVLSSIEDELLSCEEFIISVAFITNGGIEPLMQTFKQLEERGIPGRILTTDYLNFSEPIALKRLAKLKNLTLKMYMTSDAQDGFHTKGYIFKKQDSYHIIVGSSNMTQAALTKNQEWNTKIVSTKQGEFACDLLEEFKKLWRSEQTVAYKDFIDTYAARYSVIKTQRQIARKQEIPSIKQYRLEPNDMQEAFVANLIKLLDHGEHRALLISATGTGKTYASAFGLREMKPKKVLFLVHREQIAKQAKESYKEVFENNKTFGLLSGNSRDFEADYLFSTMQMMAKQEILECFSKDAFQAIVIDEAHRTGAVSYQNIMEYFEPEFWLGMTASPERTDSYDVYQAFDHNIVYEIRLQQALEANLLCPFHYFGITDLEVDGEVIDEETEFNHLTSDDRVNHIVEQIDYYGYSGDRAKGLIFCSSQNEACALSDKFNERGYQTLALTGADSQEKREEAIELLATDDPRDKLDYIFTVDIFNEGVDIPEINQVVLLRPTKSPIVFVQQLGRGLRKADEKEFVVILDFIGNYKNNFMIPIALSGDRSYNKDNVRRYLVEGERIIPGSSTIHFDEISKKRIFSAIDKANFSAIRLIKENYKNLKNKLGHIPALMDFDKYGEMDVLRIFDTDLGSYYKFLEKYEEDYKIRLSESEEKVIKFVSKKLASGKRIHELELLNQAMAYHHHLMGYLRTALWNEYEISLEEKSEKSVLNVMTNVFPSGTGKNTYADCVFLQEEGDGDYQVTDSFEKMLENPQFYDILKELVEFGISRYKQNYEDTYQDTNLVLYQKYTYEDICRLLNWERNGVAGNMGGYRYDRKTKTLPVFINYDKEEDIQDTIKYEDHFTSPDRLIAISKQSRKVASEDVQNFLHAPERGIDVELFVRKNKDDKISREFYYLGRMTATGETKEFTMANTNKTAVEIEWALDKPVREDIYEYIVNG